jgi:hypothetical protein
MRRLYNMQVALDRKYVENYLFDEYLTSKEFIIDGRLRCKLLIFCLAKIE